MFSSSLESTQPIIHHAMNAFDVDDIFAIGVKSESWGVMVTVKSGEHKGVYDYHAAGCFFVAA